MANTFKWGIKVISDSLTDSLYINPTDYSSYHDFLQSLGITLDSTNFVVNDLSKLPVFLNIIFPGSDNSWNNFAGNIEISRVIYLTNNSLTDSAESNRIKLQVNPIVTTPVTILNFSGTLNKNIAAFNWQSGVEVNFSHYEVEKSIDGKSFYSVANIEPKGNNADYSCNVLQVDSIAYYRLKMIDIDGSISYYNRIIKLAQTNLDHILKLYPNPAHDYINIEIAKPGNLFIYDAAGRLIKTQLINTGINQLDIAKLKPGVYFLLINNQKAKFVKE